jgi:hypothetical protein
MTSMIFMILAAGAASALMFASITSGELFSLLLCYLAPLPLMVAAMGWGPTTAALSGVAAGCGLAAVFGPAYGLAFAITVALPAWWLGHLALLGRPIAVRPDSAGATHPAPPELEWYPVGRILLWTSGFAALTTIAALLTLGTDAGAITGVLRRGLLRIFQPPGAPLAEETERWIEALVMLAPAAGAAVAEITLTLNLWLAAKITATSGRLHRPWPDLRTTTLPPMTLAALCVAVAFCFTGGLAALMAQTITSALLMAYAFAGFAVLHTLTQSLRSRTLWLGVTYAVVMVFTWPIMAMIALGLADAVFGLRERYWRKRPPPLPAS